MTATEKSKDKPLPPDQQLARLFGFTGEDLAINRGGYLSRRQQGAVEFGLQRLGDGLLRLLSGNRFRPRHGFKPVRSICGRASLLQLPANDPRFRQTRAMSYALFRYQVVIAGSPLPFNVTEAQYAVLVEGLVYRVYFNAEQPDHILSMERLVSGCDSML